MSGDQYVYRRKVVFEKVKIPEGCVKCKACGGTGEIRLYWGQSGFTGGSLGTGVSSQPAGTAAAKDTSERSGLKCSTNSTFPNGKRRRENRTPAFEPLSTNKLHFRPQQMEVRSRSL